MQKSGLKQKIVADIVWESKDTFWRGSKSNIFIHVQKAEKPSKKIYGWLALIVTLSKVQTRTAETRKPIEKFLFSTLENKSGKNILNLARITPQLSVKPFVVGQLLKLSKSITN
jgi:hypothetical protein